MTKKVRISFGVHEGTLITRVPKAYLLWMVNNNTPQAAEARDELDRRGDIMPDVQVSAHAVNAASLRAMDVWKVTRSSPDEGIYSWLQRMTLLALERGVEQGNGRYRYGGLEYSIEMGVEFPVLKTIIKPSMKQLTKGLI